MIPRLTSIGLAAGFAVGLLLAATWLIHVPESAEAQSGPCTFDTRMSADPTEITQGDEVTVTTQFSGTCGINPAKFHLVLVMDATMADHADEQMDVARRVVDALDPTANPGVEIGVVEFRATPTTLCALTNETARLHACLDEVGSAPIGGLRIDLALEEGLRVLLRGRPSPDPSEDVQEVMILLSDGAHSTGCPPIIQAADGVKSQNVLLVTVCVGPNCDEACMRQIATSPRYFFRSEIADAIAGVMAQVAFPDVPWLTTVEISDALPDGVEIVRGSQPPTMTVGTDRWMISLNDVVAPVVSFTYKVRVHATGQVPVSGGASLSGMTRDLQPVTATFPIPEVLVHPAPTEVPTLTPSPTVTPDSADTVYLPRVLNREG